MSEKEDPPFNGVLLLCLFGKNASVCTRAQRVQLSAVLCGTGGQCASAISRCSAAELQEE